MLILSIVTITMALVFYTVGVWGERIQGILKPWHTVFFGLGLACDTAGTWMMTRIAAEQRSAGMTQGPLVQLMGVTGTMAIVLMAVHFAWAIVVLWRNRDAEKRTFHRFSVVVWAIWLVPYFLGAASAMVP